MSTETDFHLMSNQERKEAYFSRYFDVNEDRLLPYAVNEDYDFDAHIAEISTMGNKPEPTTSLSYIKEKLDEFNKTTEKKCSIDDFFATAIGFGHIDRTHKKLSYQKSRVYFGDKFEELASVSNEAYDCAPLTGFNIANPVTGTVYKPKYAYSFFYRKINKRKLQLMSDREIYWRGRDQDFVYELYSPDNIHWRVNMNGRYLVIKNRLASHQYFASTVIANMMPVNCVYIIGGFEWPKFITPGGFVSFSLVCKSILAVIPLEKPNIQGD